MKTDIDRVKLLNTVDEHYLQPVDQEFNTQVEMLDTASDLLSPEIPDVKVPLSLFRDFFLPRYSGKVPKEEDPGWFNRWIEYIKSPSVEMAILDDHTGELVLTTPPVLSTESLVYHRGAKHLRDVAYEYEAKKNRAPMEDENYMNQALADRFHEMTEKFNPRNDAIRWMQIFRDFGFLPEDEVQKLEAFEKGLDPRTVGNETANEVDDGDLESVLIFD